MFSLYGCYSYRYLHLLKKMSVVLANAKLTAAMLVGLWVVVKCCYVAAKVMCG